MAVFGHAGIVVSAEEQQTLERVTRIATWKGRYPVAMNFYEVGVQDPITGHIAINTVWPADEFSRLSQLYDRAKAALTETMNEVPPLPADHKF